MNILFSILDSLNKDLNEPEPKLRENPYYIGWELNRLVEENCQDIVMEAYENFNLFLSVIRK